MQFPFTGLVLAGLHQRDDIAFMSLEGTKATPASPLSRDLTGSLLPGQLSQRDIVWPSWSGVGGTASPLSRPAQFYFNHVRLVWPVLLHSLRVTLSWPIHTLAPVTQ